MIRVLVVTVSDSSSEGTREDRSGPAVADRVAELGWSVSGRELVRDDSEQITELLKKAAVQDRADVVLTTGGTGVAPRDVTPEATRAAIEREIPGLSEIMRLEGRKYTHLAPLSRAVAGSRKSTLIVNLPGSPRGAVQSLNAIADLIPHVVDLLHGCTAHSSLLRNSTSQDNVP